jgi:hypothetical protein
MVVKQGIWRENVKYSPSCVNWWSGMRAGSCGLFVFCEEAFQGDVVTLFSGSRLSWKNALGECRAIVTEKPGGGRFSSQGLTSVVKASWTRSGIRLEFHGFVEHCRSPANWSGHGHNTALLKLRCQDIASVHQNTASRSESKRRSLDSGVCGKRLFRRSCLIA